MDNKLLLLMNKTMYPAEFELLRELGQVFDQLGFELKVLQTDNSTFNDELKQYFIFMKTEIDCKAVITCNADKIEYISEMPDNCLYITYLGKGEHSFQAYEEKLKYGNRNTVIFCQDSSWIGYIRENYKNIGEVLYADLVLESGGRLEAEAAMAMDIQELIAVRRGQASILKLFTQRALESGDLQRAEELIIQYKNVCPLDLDVIAMETMLDLYSGNIDLALQHALKGVHKYPCNADLYYNLGSIYEMKEEWFLAWISYGRAFAFYTKGNRNRKIEKLELNKRLYVCKAKHEIWLKDKNNAGCDYWLEKNFGLTEKAFRDPVQILGKYYLISLYEKKYAGIYWDQVLTRYYDNQLDMQHTKGEFVTVTEGEEFYIKSGKADVLLPIAAENDGTIHKILHLGNEYKVKQSVNKQFTYYRLPPDSRVYSSGRSYYGRPIPLHQEAGRKKLILNLFVDGLAQSVLDGENFKRIMPYTARFFGEGTVCTRAYSAAEWTYPSIASYATGLDITHHMLFHNTMDIPLPEEYPTLTEYFHEKGYFTSELTGNWRAIPLYGYTRGCDQYVYQHGLLGFRAQELAGEIIDHIETFKETNQVLGVCFGELHDIADGFEMPDMVQSQLDIANCTNEEIGITSVKQDYSDNKRIRYEKMATRLDILLNIVYQYIENNYDSEDILVSLYADHGQGYLVPQGEHFCSEGRARVAFMFRGSGVKSQVCDELISTCDYIKIMCRLADIKMKDIKIDGVLPKAFGGAGREYAITESLHPGDPYQAAVYANDCVFYFRNSFPVQDDGRFYLKDCYVRLADLEGNDMDNEDMLQKYLSIILEHIAHLCIYD